MTVYTTILRIILYVDVIVVAAAAVVVVVAGVYIDVAASWVASTTAISVG